MLGPTSAVDPQGSVKDGKTAAMVEIAKMAMNNFIFSLFFFAKDETSQTQCVRPQLETSMTKHFVSDKRSDTIPTIHNTRSALAAQRMCVPGRAIAGHRLLGCSDKVGCHRHGSILQWMR
jgi:hypothetical protein